MTVFIATLLGLPEVLGPLHLLWVNLVTDGPPATALGFNPPDPGLMKQHPRGRNDPLVSRFTLLRYAVTGTYVRRRRLAQTRGRPAAPSLSPLVRTPWRRRSASRPSVPSCTTTCALAWACRCCARGRSARTGRGR